MKKSILSIAIIGALSFSSCVKESNKNAVTTNTQQQNSETVIANFINDRYTYLESSTQSINLDEYFGSVSLANSFEKSYELEKQELANTNTKYTAHETKITIKSTTQNSDGTQSLFVQENTKLKTNQISAFNGEPISTAKLQEYIITIKLEGNVVKIVNVVDVDKQTLQNKKEVAIDESFTKEELESIQQMSQEKNAVAVTYNRANAVAYAAAYGVTPNPLYQDFSPGLCSYCGGDCTNFVSQCLLAGGWSQRYLKASLPTAWWYGKQSNPAGYKSGFAGVWVSASKFGVFMKTMTNRVTRVTSLSQLGVGDVIQLVKSNGNAFHTLIVTQKATNGDLYLSCHTSNRYNEHMSRWNLTSTTNYSGIVPHAFLWKIKNSY